MRETPEKVKGGSRNLKKKIISCVDKLFQSVNKGTLTLVSGQPRLQSSHKSESFILRIPDPVSLGGVENPYS